MSNEQLNMQQGIPQFEEVRDHVPFKANLGMIDRWLMGREGKRTQNVVKTTQITSSNHQNIKLEERVTMSAPIWRTFTILTSLVDTSSRAIKRGSKKQIAEDYLAMTPRAFQQHLNVLYEIGLLDFYEKMYKGETVTDIYIFPYPKYADTQACYLKRWRDIAERDGIGVQKAKRATKARIEKMILAEKEEVEKKSSQPKKSDLEKKNSQVLEKKSSQGVEKKSSQGVEKKSSHTKVINNQSNNIQSNNNQSIYVEDIQNSELPNSIKIFIATKIDRLISLNITVLDIFNDYLTHKDRATEGQYMGALGYTLELNTFTKGFKSVMATNVQKQLDFDKGNTEVNNQAAPKRKSTRKELVPEWLEKDLHKEDAPKEEESQSRKVLLDEAKLTLDIQPEKLKAKHFKILQQEGLWNEAVQDAYDKSAAELQERLKKHEKASV